MKLQLNQLIDPLAARVLVRPDGSARFDLTGVPRVDPLLVGRRVDTVPDLVTRLCGLCPVTHHLAGIAALDHLAGVEIPASAKQVRLLLHHGSVLVVLGQRLMQFGVSKHHARAVIALGQAAQRAGGMTGHFPDVAIPGGVSVTDVDTSALPELIAAIGDLESYCQLPLVPKFSAPRVDVIVANEEGEWDPLGRFLLLSAGENAKNMELIPAAVVPERIRETVVGSVAPRPEVLFDGRWQPYRVGASARYPQLGAPAAQVRSIVDSITALRDLHYESPYSVPATIGDGIGVGLVDGPRGLLIHQYQVVDGVLVAGMILTPTAQNEPWLASLLSDSGGDPQVMEAAIRAADPCLPCTAAPQGQMAIEIVEEH